MADRPTSIQQSVKEQTDRLRFALDSIPIVLLRIAELLSARAEARIDETKRFGAKRWEKQYPKQQKPFLHIAGALQDIIRTGRVESKRFEQKREHILKDTGNLLRGIDSRLIPPGNGVELVINNEAKEYAGRVQFGSSVAGPSRISISSETRDKVRELVEEAGGTIRQKKGAKKGKGGRKKTRKEKTQLKALKKLLPVVKKGELVTFVGARPFFGIDNQDARDIKRLVQDHIEEGLTGEISLEGIE